MPFASFRSFLIAAIVTLNSTVLFSVRPAQAQAHHPDVLVVPKLNGVIELDGRIEEAAWEQAWSLPIVQSRPDFGAEPTEKTEVLIGYDEDYLYAACRCYDRGTPSAPSFKRDYMGDDSDYFELILDTFNDNENALGFLTTPTGLRLDVTVKNDATGSDFLDPGWNTVWDVEVLQNDEGWFFEMRVPISSLRFQPQNGRVVMGLTAVRFIARKDEVPVFPAISQEGGAASTWKPSEAQDVAFEDLGPKTPLRVTPYLLGGGGQQNILDGSGTKYLLETDGTYDAGLDVKYGLTSNVTLDVTVNTDFAQVEADNQEVNLTRFPLFFPEKRRFFLERSSNFAFDFGGPNQLFYSRRIGLHAGHAVRILGGTRLVGRAGPWDIGGLVIQTARASEIGPNGGDIPSENFGVTRLRRRVLNPYSYVGGIATSRVGMDGAYNVAYGFDGIFRVAGDEYLSVKWAQTFDDGAPATVASLDPARILVQWERRRYDGLSYDLAYARSGSYYAPALGFELRDDYFRVGERVGYGWLPSEASVLQRYRIDLEGEAYFRNGDGSLESLEIGPLWALHSDRGHSFSIGGHHRMEDLRVPFVLSDDIAIPAGRYAFQTGELRYGMPGGEALRTSISVTAGGFYDGWRGSLQLTPTWNASRYFRMTGVYQFDRVGFPERGDAFTSHIGRIRLEVTPNVKYSIQTFIQYVSAIDGVVGNIRFRYNPAEGNDLYLVYNERLNTDRSVANPRLPLSMNRAFLLKYTYTFDW